MRWRQKEGSLFRSFQRFPPHKCLESPMFEDLKVWFYWIPSAALPAYLIAELLQQRFAIIAIIIKIGVIIIILILIIILVIIIMTIMLVCNRAEQCVCNGDRVWQDIRCHHCQLSIHPPKKIFNIFILSYDFLTVFFSSQQCNAKYIFPACKMHFFRLQIKDIGCHDCQLSLPSPQKYPTLISFQCFTFFCISIFCSRWQELFTS